MIKKSFFILLIYFSSLIHSQQNVRFMVVGDMHHYSPSTNFFNSKLYELSLRAIEEQVDFVFFTGDLILRDRTQPMNMDSLLADWKFVLDTLFVHGIRVYACRGNNDTNSELAWRTLFSGVYELPDNGPEEEKYYTYSFEYENFLFICLDEYTQYERINQAWLDQKLAENAQKVVFAAGHEPAFKLYHTNCMGAHPEERNIFWKSLMENNGLIYFCGHDHFYDHAIIYDSTGFYSNSMHQIIVGTGGGGIHPDGQYDGENGIWSPVRIFHEGAYGYLIVDVSETNITTTWIHRTDVNTYEEGGDTYTFNVTSVDDYEKYNRYHLYQNYPNPFNPNTRIKYSILKSANVIIKVFDIMGNEVSVIVNEPKSTGNYEIEFNSSGLSSGVYLYKLEAGKYSSAKKMLLIK